ncbi:hypothetical protein ACFLSQ_02650 [Bacteroidota bacterium]
MKKLQIFLIMITLICCSNINFYERNYNRESDLLNEYLVEFFINQGAYNNNSKILLYDSLKYVKGTSWPKRIDYIIKQIKNSTLKIHFSTTDVVDTQFVEALENLLTFPKINIPINFSQITCSEILNLYPIGKHKTPINPDGWEYYLSRPALNRDSTRLCFTSSYYCGPLCAALTIVFMKKVDNKWKYVTEQIIMLS